MSVSVVCWEVVVQLRSADAALAAQAVDGRGQTFVKVECVDVLTRQVLELCLHVQSFLAGCVQVEPEALDLETGLFAMFIFGIIDMKARKVSNI